MEELSQEKVQAIVSLKGTNAGRFLIEWLSFLIKDDIQRLVQEDPENLGAIGRYQGMLLRTQSILHILNAEYVDPDEAN